MKPCAIALAAMLLAGCGGVTFNVSQSIAEQRVPASAVPIAGLLPFLPTGVPITVNLQSETAAHGTGPAKHAFLSSLTLSATPHAAPSGTFDFLSEVHVFVSSPQNASLPAVEIATLKPVPRGQTTVSFTVVDGVDLLPYVNAGATITASAMGMQPAKDFSYDGRIVIAIVV
jgi:hypothetical protein